MKNQNWMFLVSLVLVLYVMLGTGGSSLLGQGVGELIEDFERSDFDDRWWSYDDGSVFSCDRESPVHDGDYALRLTFDLRA